MKRFYRDVEAKADGDGFIVTLDGKTVRTPGRQLLSIPTAALAESVAGEWRDQGEEILPHDMPLTQLANTAIDRTRPYRLSVVEQVSAYAETDLLCYRAADPPDLVQIQADSWQPLLDWAEETFEARLEVTEDIAPLEQSKEARLAIFRAVMAFDDFRLTGLHATTAVSGSVVIALALASDHIDPDRAFKASQLDEFYQVQKWGDESDARARREEIREVLSTAAHFMTLSRLIV